MKNHLLQMMLVLASIFTSHVASAVEIKEWNFLVFLNGVNNLDSFGKMNLNQMEEVGSSDKLNILVQWGSYSNKDVTRLQVIKDQDKNRVTSPILQNLGSADMGDWKELVRFVQWSHQNFPAKKYFIAVWNHGSGWNFMRLGSSGQLRPQDISYDDRTGHRITTEELAQAMAESAKIIGHKVDIYGSDACLMGMVEVASEMSDSVKYFVGSQDNEPGEGWPYSTFLSKWSAQAATISAAGVSSLLSQEFLTSYSPGGIYPQRSVTLSAYDLSYSSAYENAIAQVSQFLQGLNANEVKVASQALTSSKSFSYTDFYDLADYIDKLEKKGLKHSSFARLRQAQSKYVIANHQNQDSQTYGVSIWGASSYGYARDIRRYQGLKFDQATQWSEFLKLLYRR